MKKFKKFILIILFISIICFFIDFIRIKLNQEAIFCITMGTYKDGGTKERYGLGYKVFEYPNGKKDIGSWFLQYDDSLYEGIKVVPVETNDMNLIYYLRGFTQEVLMDKNQLNMLIENYYSTN